jgi:hypothetical protein
MREIRFFLPRRKSNEEMFPSAVKVRRQKEKELSLV